MKIMGIDSSSQKSGIAIFDGSLTHYELVDCAYMHDYDDRFPKMIHQIRKLIEHFSPDIVYIEDTWEKSSAFNNIATVKKLSYIVGGIRCICAEYGIPCNLIYPSEWRKTIGMKTGKLKREELKCLSIDYVAKKFGINVNDDVSDAICIAEAGYIINNDLFD